MGHPVLGDTGVASPRLGDLRCRAESRNALLHTEQRAGMCCSTQSWAFPTAGPDPTSHKESFSILSVKFKFDP